MEQDKNFINEGELERVAGGKWNVINYSMDSEGNGNFVFRNSGPGAGGAIGRRGGDVRPVTLDILTKAGMSNVQAKALLRHLAESGHSGEEFRYSFSRGVNLPFFAYEKNGPLGQI